MKESILTQYERPGPDAHSSVKVKVRGPGRSFSVWGAMRTIARVREMLLDLVNSSEGSREQTRAVAEIASVVINHDDRLDRLEEALQRLRDQRGRA